VWWLPEEPERKIAGVLTFSQDDISLELIGILPRPELKPDASGEVELSLGPLSRERILGLSTGGKAFTLENCQVSSFNLSMPGFFTERLAPSLILEGAHYASGEEVVFDELSVRYTQLDAWVATSGLSLSLQGEEDLAGIDVSFRPPEHLVVELPQGTIEVAFSWQVSDRAPLGTEINVKQQAAFVVRFHEPTGLEQTLDCGYQLRNLVALGVGVPVTPVSIAGFVLPPANAEPDPLTGLAPRKLRINLFYRLGNVPDVKDVHPAQMLFTLADARERLAALLENWFAKQELLRPVFDLYFGAVYNRQAFLEQRFLSLMQAIETYHRRTSAATDLPAADHERRLEEINEAVPAEHREWLEKKLKHSNELILRQRLEDVLERCPGVTQKLISSKKRSFVHRAVAARNYLTHYSPDLAQQAPVGMRLYPLTVQLQALIEMCLLRELGFGCEEIDGFFERVERYREARPS